MSAGAAGYPGLLLAARLLPGGIDFVDQVEKLLCVGLVDGSLDLGRLLRRIPEQLVQVRDGRDVLGLEVVVPQHIEVLLHEVGPLLLDVDCARPKDRVGAGLVLLDDLVAGLGLDTGLLRVVDAAWQVTVRVSGGRRPQPTGDAIHRVLRAFEGDRGPGPPGRWRWPLELRSVGVARKAVKRGQPQVGLRSPDGQAGLLTSVCRARLIRTSRSCSASAATG